MKKTLLTLASVAVICATLLSGCQSEKEVVTSSKEGQILLAVNPEILISYDENSLVTGIEGKNVDGQSIVTNYPDYIGKKCDEVLRDLVVLIKDAGYFVEDIDGQKKNIVIKIEADSYIPNGDFLNDLENAVLSTKDEGTNVVTVDRDDYDDRYVTNDYISYDKAKEIALAQAHISGDDIAFVEKEFDFDDGLAIYELEFSQGGIEYEYDIDAVTGKVISAHNSNSIQNDDTDYGPANDGITDYHISDYGVGNDGYTDYGNTDYGPNNDGVTDYNDTDYGPINDGITDYNDTDYGPNNDGVTDYNDTDYGPNNDGITDYNDTDYGPNNDGVTDYNDTDYGPNNDGITDYNDTDYGPNNDGITDYSAPAPNYSNYSNYDNASNYDNGSNYDDGNSDYD